MCLKIYITMYAVLKQKRYFIFIKNLKLVFSIGIEHK